MSASVLQEIMLHNPLSICYKKKSSFLYKISSSFHKKTYILLNQIEHSWIKLESM